MGLGFGAFDGDGAVPESEIVLAIWSGSPSTPFRVAAARLAAERRVE